MTKRKNGFVGGYSSLEMRQYQLRKIAADLENGEPLSTYALSFLSDALWRIGKGEDANLALGVKASRGQRKSVEETQKAEKIVSAMSWIAVAITPKDDVDNPGFGMSEEDAIAEISTDIGSGKKATGGFQLTYSTLKKYWDENPELRRTSFPRPLSSMPDCPERFRKSYPK